ncbi:TnsD family Tn7-like transposition protein [uncultured Pseudodesulfovibrio sp.]|uniref:TnsD family Tn7-like transposition protein n=1 Tax=uncultured Pseudodesulfovibrio sp. TaxID=2035858 RepID=UPI0029C6658C|nr:TnsD family Tn7-like transposition protein [uncultured Pseudodesulfovibrio sp.]
MLNFPVPYPDELLYSTVARAGVHFGITSPKQLLDAVFGDRKVVATVDLPSHINSISEQYPTSLGLTANEMVYKHTLFPLYAPFVPEVRRRAVLDWMIHRPKGAVHVALGITTSLVRPLKYLRICPKCLEEQLAEHGEFYWVRQWQAPGCECCLKHALLSCTQHKIRNYHRHSFVALAPTIECLPPMSNSPPNERRIERHVQELLDLPPSRSPSREQWSLFYTQAAHAADVSRKSKVIYNRLKHKILSTWPPNKLLALGIPVTDSQSNWLRLFMRKHRKSFSFLQHLVVLEALLGPDWDFREVISQARQHTAQERTPTHPSPQSISQPTLYAKREAWLEMVKTQGTRKARLSGGDAIYTWLYRNDRSWLREVNSRYRKTTRSENRRVNWHERDIQILKKLKAVRQEYANKLPSPRRSANWYLAQVGCQHLLRKMGKLPLSRDFLNNNSEDVASYQIRRIVRAIKSQSFSEGIPYWKLLRIAGLSEERLKDRTREFLRNTGWPA